MSWLTYKDDDLKGHDIMTLHFINNEKLLLLHDCTGDEAGPRKAAGSCRPASALEGSTPRKEYLGKINPSANCSKTRDTDKEYRVYLPHGI